MIYELPPSVGVCGVTYAIRSDYRAVLDICIALSDAELSDQEKTLVALGIFYPDFDTMPQEHYEEAARWCTWFIDCGEQQPSRKTHKLMDWEQDFKYLIAPINRVVGEEVRATKHLHWWSFISAYYEIGDCLFAQVVRIRDQLSKGKALDKTDREWYKNNRHLVDMKNSYTEQEETILKQWGGA